MDFEDECSPPFLIELNPSRTLSSFVFPAMRAFEEEKKNTQTLTVCNFLKYSPDRFLNISDHLI